MSNQRSKLIVICFIVQTVILLIVYHPNSTRKIFNTLDGDTTFVNRLSLYDIGMKQGTDKIILHRYETLYEKYLSRYRNTYIRLLEIGLGCGMKPEGASAQTWREYLGPEADIHLIEFNSECAKNWQNTTGRQINITMHIGSQEDEKFLEQFKASQQPFHIIIDDGGHTMDQQKTSFQSLFSLVHPGGFYVIEDLETSYVSVYGGEYLKSSTTIELIKSLVDELQPIAPKKKISVASQLLSFEIGDGICFFTKRSN